MNWTTQAVREASQLGDYGKVIKLARVAAGVSQKQLGEACGVSQSAVSRLETHGAASYDMTQLASAAAHLGIPPSLLGLSDHAAERAARVSRGKVERRGFLTGAAAAAAGPALMVLPGAHARTPDTGQAESLRLATTAFRQLDGTTPSRQLAEPVLAHLRLTRNLANEATDPEQRRRLAQAGSETASFAGWLSWDMGDSGSARTWYGSAVKAARRSSNTLLTAYQLGSLAQFESEAGNGAQALTLVRQARSQLGEQRPAIADAWLCSVEALAHAASGDQRAASNALDTAARYAEAIPSEEAPPWPWVFTFDERKVAACRLSCGARLGQPTWVFGPSTPEGLSASGHMKQQALLALDIAAAHLSAGRYDAAFSLGTRAVEAGIQFRSGRIVERARALRRRLSSPTPPKVVRDFDDRLHAAYL